MAVSIVKPAGCGLLGVFFLWSLSWFSAAEPITFDFTYAGTGNHAVAVGYVTFEDSLLPNPGFFNPVLPHPAVLDLEVTVTGAAAGNGIFGLMDFTGLVWDTNGSLLDYSMDLVGQSTAVDSWGTLSGDGGDFTLFMRQVGSDEGYVTDPGMGHRKAESSVVHCFTLAGQAGLGGAMALTSMRARQRIPTLGPWGLGLMGTLMAAAALWMRRRVQTD